MEEYALVGMVCLKLKAFWGVCVQVRLLLFSAPFVVHLIVILPRERKSHPKVLTKK